MRLSDHMSMSREHVTAGGPHAHRRQQQRTGARRRRGPIPKQPRLPRCLALHQSCWGVFLASRAVMLPTEHA